MKEEELPNIFSSDEDKIFTMEELIAEDAKDSANEDKILKKQNSKKKHFILLGSAGALAIAAIIGVISINNPFGGESVFTNENDSKVIETIDDSKSEKQIKTSKKAVDNREDFVKEEGKAYPIKLDKWQETPITAQKPADLRKSILKHIEATELYSASNTLPSAAAGYTSDDSKQLLPDGTMNPKYSYWTAEVLQYESGQYIERLINPRFGGWEMYQYPGNKAASNFNLDLISDMFTESWYEKNSEKPLSEYVPVLSDWSSDSYGMKDDLLTTGSRWYGEMQSSETKLVYNDETQQYDVSVIAKIKYTAWNKDQSKLEKNGTLTLNLVPNIDRNESDNKVLIDSASLNMEE
jgi:hypothetical protein